MLDEDFNRMRNHLISEIFHMVIIITNFPYLSRIDEYLVKHGNYTDESFTAVSMHEERTLQVPEHLRNHIIEFSHQLRTKPITFAGFVGFLERNYSEIRIFKSGDLRELSHLVDNFRVQRT